MELENEMKDIQRAENYDEAKHVFHYGRNKFGGESHKPYSEISYLVSEIEVYKLNSRERLYALEAFCIYGNSLLDNVKKLYKLGVLRHAAASLTSKDKKIFLRALTLISMITDDNKDAWIEFNDSYDIKNIFLALASAQDYFRLEALNILKNITQWKFPTEDFKQLEIVTKSIILIGKLILQLK